MTGKKLKKALQARDWSQETFAKMIGRSRQTVNYWINGKHLPDYNSNKKIKKILGL